MTINETSFTLNSQMVEWSERPLVCDLIGTSMFGGVIDEVTVFQRALTDEEIAEVRALGLRGTPLGARQVLPTRASPLADAEVR